MSDLDSIERQLIKLNSNLESLARDVGRISASVTDDYVPAKGTGSSKDETIFSKIATLLKNR